MLWGNVATLPSTLLVRLCPAGHVSPCPQLVHLYAAHKRQLDLIFAWKKRVFLWTSNNELRATSLMHSPSKYALSGNARFPPLLLPRSSSSALPPKRAQMATRSHAVPRCLRRFQQQGMRCAQSELLLPPLSFWRRRSWRMQGVAEVAVSGFAQPGWGLHAARAWRADGEAASTKGHFLHSKPCKARGCYGSGETLSLSLSPGVSLWCSVRSAARSISALPCA